MEVKFDGFDWDQGNVRKLEKHGIPPGLVEEVFRGEALMSPDLLHSNREKRFVAIGRLASLRTLFVVFTIRERDGCRLLRPISARYMHAREVKKYEKANSKI